MKFEKIQLPPNFIASLYKDTLVVIEQPNRNLNNSLKENAPVQQSASLKSKNVEDTTSNSTLNYLGNNEKQIAILEHDETAPIIREEWLQFISSILLACKLNVGDAAVIKIQNQLITYGQLHQNLNTKYCIVFSDELQKLNLPFIVPAYQIKECNDCTYLPAEPLENYLVADVTKSNQATRNLWNALKLMFHIN
jgi:hypothetical protein